MESIMAEQNDKRDKNIGRRKFLKKMASSAVFVIPTIQTFSLLQAQSWQPWTQGMDMVTITHHHQIHGHRDKNHL